MACAHARWQRRRRIQGAVLGVVGAGTLALGGSRVFAATVEHTLADVRGDSAQAIALTVGMAMLNEGVVLPAGSAIPVLAVQGGGCAAAGVPVDCAARLIAGEEGRVTATLGGDHWTFVPPPEL